MTFGSECKQEQWKSVQAGISTAFPLCLFTPTIKGHFNMASRNLIDHDIQCSHHIDDRKFLHHLCICLNNIVARCTKPESARNSQHEQQYTYSLCCELTLRSQLRDQLAELNTVYKTTPALRAKEQWIQ